MRTDPIAVLGGGPAGAAAALALARGGAEVDLYLPERPGEKPCGGAVPEHVLPRLAGFDPAPLPAVVSPAAVLENAAGGRVELALDGIRCSGAATSTPPWWPLPWRPEPGGWRPRSSGWSPVREESG